MAPTSKQILNAKIKSAASTKSKRPKARVIRYLKKHTEPQLIENPKSLLLLKGQRCSDSLSEVLKDLRAMKAPHAKLLNKNNAIAPLQDESGAMSLEFLCTKNDCSLFAMASHNKKRPNNLLLGRTFDRRILDAVEVAVTRYKSLSDYRSAPKKRVASKPLLLFNGDVWHLDAEGERLRNLFVDFFRGEEVERMSLSGIDHIMVFTAVDVPGVGQMFHMRTYFVKLKKDPRGGTTPVPYLMPCGPDMDFKIRRKQFAASDLWKAAMKQPKETKVKKVKNQTTNLFGETIGRLHIESQDIDKRQGKKSKALRIAGKIDAEMEKKAIEEELEREKGEMGKEFEETYGFEEMEEEGDGER